MKKTTFFLDLNNNVREGHAKSGSELSVPKMEKKNTCQPAEQNVDEV